MRGLLSIISQTGLGLEKLLGMKDLLIDGMMFFLTRHTLCSIRLEFLNRSGNVIANGFGLWSFTVSYGSSGKGVIELPVSKVVAELQRNASALAAAVNYTVTLTVKEGAELPPGWNWSKRGLYSSGQRTHITSFGYDPLHISVHRE
jgi:hypothetical protein